ncbi:hypothetical protein L837_4664 [Mycobacterium avium MAV_061107_1842]|nr:hypothetical protein L837_4664 [Mycobacterium avium MAV_061107_1842]
MNQNCCRIRYLRPSVRSGSAAGRSLASTLGTQHFSPRLSALNAGAVHRMAARARNHSR